MDSRPCWQKSISLSILKLFENPPETFSFVIVGIFFSKKILVEQGKVQLLLENFDCLEA
jgi:hypothetical protein